MLHNSPKITEHYQQNQSVNSLVPETVPLTTILYLIYEKI